MSGEPTHLSRLVIQEGPVFHADTHAMPKTASNPYALRRRAACQIVLARDHERTREYLNFDFGWWDRQDDTFRRVRYMPSRWADEFIVALRRAQAHIAQHETALFVDLAAKLDGRLGPP